MPSTAEILAATATRPLPPGHRCFIVQLSRLQPCLEKAAAARVAAPALYSTPARQWLFQLQALCRIYKKAQDKKPFKKMAEPIKALEDQLGAVDYWDGWRKAAVGMKDFPSVMLAGIERHLRTELDALETILRDGAWLANDLERLATMLEELAEVDWHEAKRDRHDVRDFLVEELQELESAYHEGVFDFEELEDGVHEFRRKIRWFSIYAQSLEGLVQLKPIARPDAVLRRYLTTAVVESRFNALPPPQVGTQPLRFEAPHFYALSWLIAELGIIKDDGQKCVAFAGLAEESGWSGSIAGLLSDVRNPLDAIPKTVEERVREFVDEAGVLRRLASDLSGT
ncbi:MAG: hypothetical protein RL088_317 [Verrucomicrobiota bacterium]|jgi:hypothetical protein